MRRKVNAPGAGRRDPLPEERCLLEISRNDPTSCPTMSTPLLSIILVFHQMAREAPRTLYSVSRAYQRGIDGLDYEVIALDHGSSPPLDADLPKRFGREFIYRRVDTRAQSPVHAINAAARSAHGTYLAVHIDGARILSPGVLAGFHAATRVHPAPFAHTMSFHLGPGLQNQTMLEGYDRAVEDRLLASVDWMADGYRLFTCSVLAGSSASGFFGDIMETNCFLLPRRHFLDMGGFHPDFQTPGGGLCNLDFYSRAIQDTALQPVRLLGEGTFHQFHGGVATNVPSDRHPFESFQTEYRSIRGRDWTPTIGQEPIYLGRVHPASRPFLMNSADTRHR